MSNGGMIAQAIGCKLGNKIDAIINIVGMQAEGMSCAPEDPVSIVMYGAKNVKCFIRSNFKKHNLLVRSCTSDPRPTSKRQFLS